MGRIKEDYEEDYLVMWGVAILIIACATFILCFSKKPKIKIPTEIIRLEEEISNWSRKTTRGRIRAHPTDFSNIFWWHDIGHRFLYETKIYRPEIAPHVLIFGAREEVEDIQAIISAFRQYSRRYNPILPRRISNVWSELYE